MPLVCYIKVNVVNVVDKLTYTTRNRGSVYFATIVYRELKNSIINFVALVSIYTLVVVTETST